MVWPPQWQVVHTSGGGEYNAVAFVDEADGKLYPKIEITYGYLEVVISTR